MEMSAPIARHDVLLVACLCAEWCGTCRDYRATLSQALSSFDPARLSVAWIDIEDHDEVLGAIDVQNFPTVLIARADQVLFFGTVTPHAQTLTRLVQGALDGGALAHPQDGEVQALAARIRAFVAAGSGVGGQ